MILQEPGSLARIVPFDTVAIPSSEDVQDNVLFLASFGLIVTFTDVDFPSSKDTEVGDNFNSAIGRLSVFGF